MKSKAAACRSSLNRALKKTIMRTNFQGTLWSEKVHRSYIKGKCQINATKIKQPKVCLLLGLNPGQVSLSTFHPAAYSPELLPPRGWASTALPQPDLCVTHFGLLARLPLLVSGSSLALLSRPGLDCWPCSAWTLPAFSLMSTIKISLL